MTRKFWKTSTGAVALGACALVGAAVAFGAGATTTTATTTTTNTTTAGKRTGTHETALTGDTLAKVKAAATARVGGTVDAATTENENSNAAAAYEAHVTKADGTHVTVILDSAYNVLGVESARAGRHGHDPGRGAQSGETALTGDIATKAKAAAVARVGGTTEEATTEADGSNSAAAYEVHVTKTDGSHVVVILDKGFAVLAVETHGQGSEPHAEHQR